VPDDLRTVRERLEADLGRTLRPAEFARLARVTPAAIQKWVDKQEVATVRTRGGRREIPTSEALSLLDEIAQARE
jgi:predicted site-specific integrase-resolvase